MGGRAVRGIVNVATTTANVDAAEQLAGSTVMPPCRDVEEPAWPRDFDVEETAAAGGVRKSARFVHNLPVQLTSFIGRDAEMTQVRALLAGSRLVTLTGAGGVGKTRLALEVAAGMMPEFSVGVWQADLAPLTDPGLVPITVARAIGLRDAPRRSTMATVTGFIGPRRALVLLDNCEHLLDACAQLAEDMLRTCPGLVILATSREPVGVAGEAIWRVPSLPVEADAVELFADRAQRARPGFAVTPDNHAAVAEICRRLDGIPLAIELAAARLRAFSPAEIAAGLHDRFRLLTGGSRTAARRQQTLRASVDWSHALLTEQERILFRRIAVFAGGFDLDAAEAVGAGNGLDLHQVLDELVSLVDKSLVVAEESQGTTRYRLLETVRQYALEKLGDSDEANTVRTRHRDYYTRLATRRDRPPTGHVSGHTARMEGDIDNLRAAFQWSLELSESETALRLASALQPLWLGGSRQLEGLAWFDAALDGKHADGEPVASDVWVRAVTDAATLDRYTDSPLRHLAQTTDAVARARGIGDSRLLSRALASAGCDAALLGEDWQPYFDEALGLARQAGEARQLTHILGWLAFVAAVIGDVVINRSAAEEGLAMAEQTGNSHVSRLCRIWLGQILVCQGDLHRARSLYYDLIAEAEAERAQVGQMLGLVGLGITLACLGQAGEARAAGEASMAISDDLGGNAGTFDCYMCLAYAAMASGDTATLRETSQAGWHLINTWLEAGTLRRLGAGIMHRFSAEADLAAGELAAARQHADAAVAAATRPGASPVLTGALLLSARVAAAEGEALRAQDEACQALTMGHSIEARLSIIEGLECLGRLTHVTEDLQKGARLLGAADALRQRIGYRRFLLHQARDDAAVQALLSSLGDEAFARAWDEGAALSLDEAVSYALRGRGHRNRPQVGWLSLTRAERDVARLLNDGLSNRDIADRLFVSPRTVQSHLTHIYAKLGITSRVRLAQQAALHASGS